MFRLQSERSFRAFSRGGRLVGGTRPKLAPRSARMGSSLSRALAAVRGQERRRPIQMAVGVMNAKFRRAFERRTIMSTWGSMPPESRLAVRFVQRCRSCNQTKHRSCVKVVCVDEETEHQKAIAWFRLALDLFPRAQWICHSDDDVFVQARQVRRQAGSPNHPQVLRAETACTSRTT